MDVLGSQLMIALASKVSYYLLNHVPVRNQLLDCRPPTALVKSGVQSLKQVCFRLL